VGSLCILEQVLKLTIQGMEQIAGVFTKIIITMDGDDSDDDVQQDAQADKEMSKF